MPGLHNETLSQIPHTRVHTHMHTKYTHTERTRNNLIFKSQVIDLLSVSAIQQIKMSHSRTFSFTEGPVSGEWAYSMWPEVCPDEPRASYVPDGAQPTGHIPCSHYGLF